MSLREYAEDLSYLFNVSKPLIHYSCEQSCPSASRCSWIACYDGREHSVNFKTSYANPVVFSHEWGHHLFHTFYPGKCPGASNVCEEYAMDFEEWTRDMSSYSDTHTFFRCEGCGAIMMAEKTYSTIGCPECHVRYRVWADGRVQLLS